MDIKTKINDGISIQGQAIITTCDVSSQYAKRREQEILEAIKKTVPWGVYRSLVDDFNNRFIKRQVLVNNVVCNNGKKVFAKILSGNFTYSGVANYCALGTGNSSSAKTDTKLGTEAFRKLISSKTYVDLATYLSTFFSAGDCNGTYYEIAHYIDGTITADSGQIWSHICNPDTAELPITKGVSDSLTVDYKSLYT